MTGADHYLEAERLLAIASQRMASATENTVLEEIEGARVAAALAQVHATLAQTAAVVDVAEWLRVAAAGDVAESLPWLQAVRS